MRGRSRGRILGVGVDRISCSEAADLICDWAARHAPRMVLAANVHMTMEAVDDPAFRGVLDSADLVVADGMPLYWTLRARGFSDAHHVRGQDLVLAVCAAAEKRGLRLGLYGTTDDVLSAAARRIAARFPRLAVTYSYAPPFRALTGAEDRGVVEAITAAGVDVLLVAIGCPKQEKWIAAHMDSLSTVMIGAGAAIDMLGDGQPVAPRWMQASGLEWLFRLASDPARLWRRYARSNLRFIVLVLRETFVDASGGRRSGRPRARE